MRETARAVLVSLLVAASLQGCGDPFGGIFENQVEIWMRHLNKGYAELQQKHFVDAEKEYLRARAVAERIGGRSPQLAATLQELADVYFVQARYADASRLYEQASKIYLGLWRAGGAGADARAIVGLETLTAMAKCYQLTGDKEKEASLAEQCSGLVGELDRKQRELALALCAVTAGRADDTKAPQQLDIAGIAIDVGQLRSKNSSLDENNKPDAESTEAARALAESRFDDAALLYEKVVARLERSGASQNPQLDGSMLALGDAYMAACKYKQAKQVYDRLIGLRKKSLGAFDPQLAILYKHLYARYKEHGLLAQAEEALLQELSVKETQAGRDSMQLVDLLSTLGFHCNLEKKFDQAASFFERELSIEQKTMGRDNPALYKVLYCLANTYYVAGRYSKVDYLSQQLSYIKEKTKEKTTGQTSSYYYQALFLQNLANMYEQLQRPAECELPYRKLLAIQLKTSGPKDPQFGLALMRLAGVLTREAKFDEAKALYERALPILRQAPPDQRSRIVYALSQHISILEKMHYSDEARSLRDLRSELSEKRK